MSCERKCLIGAAVVAIALASAPVCRAQLPEPPELLVRLWPFFRVEHPVPLLPTLPTEGPEKKERLIAPFVQTKIDINNCTLAELQRLPGVTPSQAARIMAGRPYRNFADLERDDIPLTVVRRLRGSIVFGP
jgi:hypothetical protein